MSEQPLQLRVLRLPHARDLPLLRAESTGSAGMDLRAATDGDVVLQPGGRGRVQTGLVLEIPPGWEGQVRPRSGLAAAHGITLTNAPGTIDCDYRGEVEVLLINLGNKPFVVRRGERIAQLVLAPVARVEVVEVAEVEATDRGRGGFGSTGRE